MFNTNQMAKAKNAVYLPFYQGIFSQWHYSKFQDPDLPIEYREHVFTSSEMYMMFCKAMLFEDHKHAHIILKEHDCKKTKALGRSIIGFNEKKWEEHRENIVTRGNYLKFTQNHVLKAKLLATDGKHLVEASPRDCIWGIGLCSTSPCIQSPAMWRGLNLLGKCLDRAREMILNDEKDDFLNSNTKDENVEKMLSYNRFESRIMSDKP